MLGDNIKLIMEKKKVKSKDLAEKVNISPIYLSYILNNKKQNPSKRLLEKIAKELDVTVDTFFKTDWFSSLEILCDTKDKTADDSFNMLDLKDLPAKRVRNEIVHNVSDTSKRLTEYFDVTPDYLIQFFNDYINKNDIIDNTNATTATTEFNSPEEAMKFILNQPAIMGYGGFDISKLSDEEIVDFANELLVQLQLVSYKYKK